MKFEKQFITSLKKWPGKLSSFSRTILDFQLKVGLFMIHVVVLCAALPEMKVQSSPRVNLYR